MARADFNCYDTRGGSGAAISTKYAVTSGTTASIVAGEMIRQHTSTASSVQLCADGDGDTRVYVGVVASDSDETSSAAGTVWVFDNPLNIFRGRATTPSNLTATLRNTQVTLDVASGTNGAQTIDENDTTNGTFRIIDFDTQVGTVLFGMALLDNLSEG